MEGIQANKIDGYNIYNNTSEILYVRMRVSGKLLDTLWIYAGKKEVLRCVTVR